MPIFLDTRGYSEIGIGICDRCKFKFPIVELMSDPNYPGLKVCYKDKDQFDPYRLPARQTERITLRFTRPDLPLDGTQTPVFDVLSRRLVTEGDNVAIVTEDGKYIDVEGEVGESDSIP